MLTDNCSDCGEPLDVTKRLYQGPNGLRCPICQVLADLHLEIVRVTTIAEMLAEFDARRLH